MEYVYNDFLFTLLAVIMSFCSCKVFEVDSVVNLQSEKFLLHFLMKMSTIPSISLKYKIISDGVEVYGRRLVDYYHCVLFILRVLSLWLIVRLRCLGMCVISMLIRHRISWLKNLGERKRVFKS